MFTEAIFLFFAPPKFREFCMTHILWFSGFSYETNVSYVTDVIGNIPWGPPRLGART